MFKIDNFNARGEIRTPIILRSLAPEASASTNFATRAEQV